MSSLYSGTSAFTAAGWEGTFYPPGMKPVDFLSHYATKFNTVEVDSTFYRTPSKATVLGWDRKGIEEQTKTWDKVIVDRSEDLAEWVEVLKTVHKRKIQIYAYANNHYAGYAPATVEMFQELWRRAVKENGKSRRATPQGQLFR